MPGLLTDKHPETPEAGIEGTDFLARLYKSGFVKHSISWKKDFPMNVANVPFSFSGLNVGDTVIEPAASTLVEAKGKIRCPWWRFPQIFDQLFDRN